MILQVNLGVECKKNLFLLLMAIIMNHYHENKLDKIG